MHGHLVAVEVGVVGRAGQRVQLERAALHQHRLKGLDAQAVQRRRAVQQHGVVADYDFERIPDLRLDALDRLARRLDVSGGAGLDQALHHERLEELQRHLLRQAALVHLQLRADHDDRAARIVHALAQQVLAEAPLLALQHVGEGLERAVVRPGHGAAAAAVVDQGVHGLLQHTLLVADDDVRRAQLQQPLQAVVAVDHAAVQVVEVGRREPAAVELHHGAQVRRNHGDAVEDHPFRPVAGKAERLDHFQALEEADALLPAGGGQLFLELLRKLVEVDFRQQFLDGFGAHAGLKIVLVLFAHVAVFLLVEELLLLQLAHVAGVGDDIQGKVEDLLQHAGRDVEHQAHAGRDALEIPDMGNRRGQLDVAHPLAADLGPRDLHAAALADFALIADALVFSAVALPVLGGAEDALAEQAVAFRLERAVVDGLRLFDLAVRPLPDFFGRSKSDLDGFKRVKFHAVPLPVSCCSRRRPRPQGRRAQYPQHPHRPRRLWRRRPRRRPRRFPCRRTARPRRHRHRFRCRRFPRPRRSPRNRRRPRRARSG